MTLVPRVWFKVVGNQQFYFGILFTFRRAVISRYLQKSNNRQGDKTQSFSRQCNPQLLVLASSLEENYICPLQSLLHPPDAPTTSKSYPSYLLGLSHICVLNVHTQGLIKSGLSCLLYPLLSSYSLLGITPQQIDRDIWVWKLFSHPN